MSAVHSPSEGPWITPVVQQCMHCGLCLPTCPTYERQPSSSATARADASRSCAPSPMAGLEPTRGFADEMYFCLGCLACMTACSGGRELRGSCSNTPAPRRRQSGALHSPRAQFHSQLHNSVGFFMDLNRLQLVRPARSRPVPAARPWADVGS